MGQVWSSIFQNNSILNKYSDNTMFWKVVCGILLAKYGISFLYFVMTMLRLYVLPKFGMRLDLKKYGSWAVITGATDGIGKAVAKQLGKRGLNLVLISRSSDKLEAVKKELQDGKIEIKTIVYDYSNPDDYDKIEDQLKSMEIGLLVNNVGMSYDHPDEYLFYDEEYYDRLINLNITSVLKMTRIVLKGMEARKKGLLVHVSSASSILPVPYLSTYSASKAFVNNFGESLHYECASKGIKSQVVLPYFVESKLSKLRANGFTIPSADCYARQLVNAIGLTPSMAGYWCHEILIQAQALLPKSILVGQTLSMMKGLKRRWEKKQQQKKE